jgi:pyrophosphatase PpaX
VTPSITTLIFDWDGTLADSAALGLIAFQKTFADLGIPFPLDIYEASYSPNWYATYEALGVSPDKWQMADDLWLRHYGDQSAGLIEGVAETLWDLKHKGYRLGIVSSGNEIRVCREIERSDLRGCFQVVVCNEHIVNKKPHPEGLELALRQMGSTSSESAYVGDAPEDIQMGKLGKVLTIGVRSAYPSSARVLAADPDLYLESLRELSQHFK